MRESFSGLLFVVVIGKKTEQKLLGKEMVYFGLHIQATVHR